MAVSYTHLDVYKRQGLDAALGYAYAAKIPYGIGLIKNKYIGRTFISPEQEDRLDKVRIKLSPVKSVIDGKRVILIDDSIVRGTTSKQIVKLLRDAGAVSYTHLDVYKRQNSESLQKEGMYMSYSAVNTIWVLVGAALVSVSYTHLEVYKRQVRER